MLVGDDRNESPGDRQPNLLADQPDIALVRRVHRDGHVGEHRLRPGRRDLDEPAAVNERIAQRPELALHFPRLDFEVADCGLEFRVPVHQTLVAVQQTTLVKLDEHVRHRARKALVHGEPLVRPVTRRTEPPELAGDRSAALRLPFPHMLEEGLAADLGALDALALQVALDHHLRRDPGMVGADHPQGVLAVHSRAADEDVLERIVERVADVEAAGDVGRRHDDGERFAIVARRAEQAAILPMRIPARLDRAGVESLGKLAHARRLAGGEHPSNRHPGLEPGPASFFDGKRKWVPAQARE